MGAIHQNFTRKKVGGGGRGREGEAKSARNIKCTVHAVK